MTNRKIPKSIIVLTVIALCLIAGKIAWSEMYPSGTWRYKITINVDTPEGLKSGSAVREFTVIQGLALTPESLPKTVLKGEAVVVDLDEMGVLFNLIEDNGDIVYNAFPGPAPYSREGIEYYSHLNTKASLTAKQLGRTVTFKNRNDPKTVELIDLGNLEKTFGKGTKFNSAEIEMTRDPITWNAAKDLSWLKQFYNKRLDGNRFGTIETNNKLANSLSSGSFSTGDRND